MIGFGKSKSRAGASESFYLRRTGRGEQGRAARIVLNTVIRSLCRLHESSKREVITYHSERALET